LAREIEYFTFRGTAVCRTTQTKILVSW